MARPLRFRQSNQSWSDGRVRADLFQPLDSNLGAHISRPWYRQPDGWDARRFEMDDDSIALFCWSDDQAFWLGNTETPSALWQTEKYRFDEVPAPVAEWAQRELLAQLHEEEPWLEAYPSLSWFFLPVLLSKDGRDTTRTFFREHAAGFPDVGADEALEYYEGFFETGVLDEHRYVMASKLGTSESLDLTRMSATMGEFNTAKLLTEAEYDVVPEIEVTTGHSLDFRVDPVGVLVEVTRPLPPRRRTASNGVAAVRETAQAKTNGQLRKHGGGAILFVDCSSFPEDDWTSVLGERPEVRHRPAVVFRARPDGHVTGYRKGAVPLDIEF